MAHGNMCKYAIKNNSRRWLGPSAFTKCWWCTTYPCSYGTICFLGSVIIIIITIIKLTVVIPRTCTPTPLNTSRIIHGNENIQQHSHTRTKYNHAQSQTTSGKPETGNEFTLDNILLPRTIFTSRLIHKTK
jgi:hypothetical protein